MLIIPCDLITDISLHNIANLHRTHDASLTMLLSSLPSQFYESVAPGARSKKPLGKIESNVNRESKVTLKNCTLVHCEGYAQQSFSNDADISSALPSKLTKEISIKRFKRL